MKTEIIEIAYEEFNENLTGGICFESPQFMRTVLAKIGEGKFGVIIINGTPIKYYFSPTGMDGDIYTKDRVLYSLVKVLIPAYYYHQEMTSEE